MKINKKRLRSGEVMSFWLKDYSILLNKLDYLQFKLTDKELSSAERTAAEGELQYCLDRKEQFEKLVSRFDSIEQKNPLREICEQENKSYKLHMN